MGIAELDRVTGGIKLKGGISRIAGGVNVNCRVMRPTEARPLIVNNAKVITNLHLPYSAFLSFSFAPMSTANQPALSQVLLASARHIHDVLNGASLTTCLAQTPSPCGQRLRRIVSIACVIWVWHRNYAVYWCHALQGSIL